MAPILILSQPSSADALHAAYEQRAASAEPGSPDDWRRDHLGASVIGHKCDRYLWLTFRWASNPKHEGRMLRLFERGKREEAWVVDDRRAAGLQVHHLDPETGDQFRMLWHGHFGGSIDGKVLGLVEAPKTEHVLEVKTHNAKSFARLVRDGVRRAKPEHWAQMQVYMLGTRLDRAFYVAVNKDTDEIYTERVKLDLEEANALVERARGLIESTVPAPRLDPEFPPCVYTSADGTRWPCQFFELCHGDGKMPEKNCRTCVSSTPRDDGSWFCAHRDEVPDRLAQRKGCADHLTIPHLVNAQVVTVGPRQVTYQTASGRTIVDGPE